MCPHVWSHLPQRGQLSNSLFKFFSELTVILLQLHDCDLTQANIHICISALNNDGGAGAGGGGGAGGGYCIINIIIII